MTTPRLTREHASHFANIALSHVGREYPNNVDHALAEPADARTPSQLHPIFYGSYDWHSCVHSYWMLARLLRRFPDFAAASDIRALFDTQFVPEKVAAERAYFARPTARGFKRPYGWAWLLKLATELALHPDDRWSRNLAPLAEIIAQRFRDFLPLAFYPVRVGTHFNTAFGLRMAADYAGIKRMKRSPGCCTRLASAGMVRTPTAPPGVSRVATTSSPRLLSRPNACGACCPRTRSCPGSIGFCRGWSNRRPATLFKPATVTDRTDGKIAHLDGLNLSRAWCWRSLGDALPAGDPRRVVAHEAAREHLAAGLPHIAGHYMGEHWLASFAVLALDDEN